jgi:hypothetical protein
MGARGYHMAITAELLGRLLELDETAEDYDEVIDLLERFYSRGNTALMDKAWDHIHRTLTLDNTPEGKVNPDAGYPPLSWCVLGGAELDIGEDGIAYTLGPHEVAEAASALAQVDERWLRKRFFLLDPEATLFAVNEDDFTYMWSYFLEMRALFARAAAGGRAIVFEAGQ